MKTKTNLNQKIKVQNEKRKTIEVVVLKQFPVFWQGWELDADGYVVQLDDGTKKLVLGGRIVPVGHYEEKIEEYQDAIDQTRAAIEMVAGK